MMKTHFVQISILLEINLKWSILKDGTILLLVIRVQRLIVKWSAPKLTGEKEIDTQYLRDQRFSVLAKTLFFVVN